MIPPVSNPELHGHKDAEAQLFRLIKQQKLPHAIMLAGPQGIGKATLAYRLAKYLLSGQQPAEATMGLFGEEPVEESLKTEADHPAIQRMIAGTHGDLLVIQPQFDEKKKTSADTIFIEQVRKVVDFMHHTPSESSWRVVIVDPAEAMNTNAANALLKVLEEPPAQALLILVSHQPGRLLPTIRSRCRVMNLQAPSADATASIFAQQQSGADDATLQQLLQLAQGSPGLALQFHEQGALTLYHQLLACLQSGDAQAIQKFAADAAKAAPQQWPVIRAMLLQALYRLSLSQRLTDAFTPLDAEEKTAFDALSRMQPLPYWLELWEKAETLLAQVTSLTLDKKQVLISLLSGHVAQRRAA